MNKDDILNIKDIFVEAFHVPEWGMEVFLRSWTEEERVGFYNWFTKAQLENKADNLFARVACLSLSDEHGNRLFKDTDIKALSQKNSVALERIYHKAIDKNKIDETSIEQAKN